MSIEQKGWVILNDKIPGKEFIVANTFDRTRQAAIERFVNGSSKPWGYWQKTLGFRAVRATSKIVTVK